MAFNAQDSGNLGLNINARPSSLDFVALQRTIFPTEAFTFDDPNRVDEPELKMKAPWKFVADYIKSSGDPWNYQGTVGQVPSGAYFSSLRTITESAVALLDKEGDDLLPSEGVTNLIPGSINYTIAGSVSYDLTGIPEYVIDGGYTILVYSELLGWEYLSGSGVSYGNIISKSGDIITITSSNLLPLTIPFTLYSYKETFRDLMIIPQNYTQTDIDNLIDTNETFSWETGSMSADRGFTLSPDGFYWYNGGQYIKLGTEAIFNGVDLKSGNWNGTITDGEITTPGTLGWGLSHKGDFDTSDGTFRGILESGEIRTSIVTAGELSSPDFVVGESGWAIDSGGFAEFQDCIIRGEAYTNNIRAYASNNNTTTYNFAASDPGLDLYDILTTHFGTPKDSMLYSVVNFTLQPTARYMRRYFNASAKAVSFYTENLTHLVNYTGAIPIGTACSLQLNDDAPRLLITDLLIADPGLSGVFVDSSGFLKVGSSGTTIPR